MFARSTIVIVAVTGTWITAVQAQSTAFTYQGLLNTGGAPANGVYDFQVALWNAETLGFQIGSANTIDNVVVENGLFLLSLDFGSNFFSTSRYLEISVRPDGRGPYTTLTPRQLVSPTPMALHALNGSVWTYQNDYLTYEDGSVGIGASTPNALLHVQGSDPNGLSFNANNQLYVNQTDGFVGVNRDTPLVSTEAFGIYKATTGYGGMYVETDPNGLPFYGYAAGGSVKAYHWWNDELRKWYLYASGTRMTIDASNGYVGIGTTSPTAKLHVAGAAGVDGIRFPDGTLQTTAASSAVTTYWAANGNDITNTNSGDVGVGTGSPSAKLHAETSGVVALRGSNTNGNYGYLGSTSLGGYATHNNGNFAQLATGSYGLYAKHDSSENYGYIGSSNFGVFGRHDATAHYGRLGSADEGVYGASTNDNTAGYLGGGVGVYGEKTDAGTSGSIATSLYGVVGVHSSGSYGGMGSSTHGVVGSSNNASGAGGVFLNTAGGKALIASGVAQVDVLEIIGGSDLAEPFDVHHGDVAPRPGMVVCIDTEHAGDLVVSSTAYDRTVAGVISGAGGVNPGMIMRQEGTAVASGTHPVALTGRVKVYCQAHDEPIQPGDLLTTSDTPGHAMRVSDHSRATGAIIGKAMSALAAGERGLVLVLVNLH